MRSIQAMAVAAAGAVVLGGGAAGAQTAQRVSIQASGLFAGLFGSAFDEIKSGFGGEAQIRFTPGAWSIGGGVQYTIHKTSGDAESVIPKVKLAGIFVEPRYVIDAGSQSFAPYLSARLAVSQMSFTLADQFQGLGINIDKPTGPTINGGGGVLVRLSNRANLDVGATFGYTRFKDIVISGGGQSETVQVGSGTNLVFRVGLAFGIGG